MKKHAFKIGSSADTASELLRTLEHQLLYISDLFSPVPKDAGEAIHKARQTYKKCRALLRLMRDSMGYAAYYRENLSLREMQRELSQIRDADVQNKLFTRLAEDYPEFGKKAWFRAMVGEAKRNYDMEMNHFIETGKASDISRQSHAKALQCQKYSLSGEGFELIEGGLNRIYRQGREMGNMVFMQEADAFEIHSFRKKAKYLQYQLTYLRPISKSLIKTMSSTMEQLSDKLGYYNDLHIACNRIQAYSEQHQVNQKKNLEILLDSLREDMERAKADSRKIYEMQYAEEPKHYIRRLGRYWELYEQNLGEEGPAPGRTDPRH
jgi:CHAD domain-containing protein